MAGAGYKLFNTGDVLTAAQVNTYLQEQAVMRFANAAARTTALSGVLAEGMVSYLDDTNQLEVYDGATWTSASGDITGVTAGTGISGGGTSGTVTITNSMATEITASGDIIVGTGSGTFDNLPIGTTGQVLTADTTVSPYKVKWAAAGLANATSYTPATTNWTLGNGTMTTYYVTSGDTVFYYGRILFGSTTSVTGAMRIGLPFNSGMTVNASYLISTSGYFQDASTGNTYQLALSGPSPSQIGLNVWQSSGTYVDGWVNINATTPVTLATNDEFQFYVWYRKA